MDVLNREGVFICKNNIMLLSTNIVLMWVTRADEYHSYRRGECDFVVMSRVIREQEKG